MGGVCDPKSWLWNLIDHGCLLVWISYYSSQPWPAHIVLFTDSLKHEITNESECSPRNYGKCL